MVGIVELTKRINFWLMADRLGPDMPLTHVRLHFPSSQRRLCTKKFRHFGSGAEFRPGAYAVTCSKISIGKNVVIRPGVMLFASSLGSGGRIEIHDDVLIGPGVHFYTSYHKFSDPNLPIFAQGYDEVLEEDSISVYRGAWIGANAILLRGVTVGENSVVAAGSVVTKSVPPRVVVAGVPARVIRTIRSKPVA